MTYLQMLNYNPSAAAILLKFYTNLMQNEWVIH